MFEYCFHVSRDGRHLFRVEKSGVTEAEANITFNLLRSAFPNDSVECTRRPLGWETWGGLCETTAVPVDTVHSDMLTAPKLKNPPLSSSRRANVFPGEILRKNFRIGSTLWELRSGRCDHLVDEICKSSANREQLRKVLEQKAPITTSLACELASYFSDYTSQGYFLRLQEDFDKEERARLEEYLSSALAVADRVTLPYQPIPMRTGGATIQPEGHPIAAFYNAQTSGSKGGKGRNLDLSIARAHAFLSALPPHLSDGLTVNTSLD